MDPDVVQSVKWVYYDALNVQVTAGDLTQFFTRQGRKGGNWLMNAGGLQLLCFSHSIRISTPAAARVGRAA